MTLTVVTSLITSCTELSKTIINMSIRPSLNSILNGTQNSTHGGMDKMMEVMALELNLTIDQYIYSHELTWLINFY